MGNFYIALNDIPPQGQHITLDEPAIWQTPLEEFHMECRIVAPLRAELLLLPTDGGCLIRGTLTGAVVLPCDRCAEDAPAEISHTVEQFAALPRQDALSEEEDDDDTDDDSNHVVLEKGVPMLDLAALCWEEFMLALPLRPLCSPQCKGLCAQCGVNLNTGTCSCVKDSGDPRLAALRQFKVQKPDTTPGK